MKNLFIAFMLLSGIFSLTSCTKDVPTPTNNFVTTAKTNVAIIPANDCGKDDDADVILTIKVTDDINSPVSEVLVQLEGIQQNYNFATNGEGQYEEATIETGSYSLSVIEDNATLIILNATQNNGTLTIKVQ